MGKSRERSQEDVSDEYEPREVLEEDNRNESLSEVLEKLSEQDEEDENDSNDSTQEGEKSNHQIENDGLLNDPD